MNQAGENTESTKQTLQSDRTERGGWSSRVEFLLSCIGQCAGLGSVWRFPYVAYENGGGVFLIPYLIMLVFCGIPLLMIEFTLGQFSGNGAITAWRSIPLFKGIGLGAVFTALNTSVYYNMIAAYSFYYLFASFTSVLPWTLCNEWWNKEAECLEIASSNKTSDNMTTSSIATTYSMTTTQMTNVTNATMKRTSPSEEYWEYRVLRIDQSSGIEDPGIVLWDLCLCLLLAWIIVFFCLFKGVKSYGKVVYFMATFPYVILIILLIRGCTLEGAGEGILFFVRPEWEKLQTSKIWIDAVTLVFFSLGNSIGVLTTFASYNKFDNKIFRDSLIIGATNVGTCLIAGFVAFSVIGHMALKLGLKIKDVVSHGPGLAFVVYPEAVSLLPAPQFWSILFFLMIITLGFDTQLALVHTVTTGLMDQFPKHLRNRKVLLTGIICIVCYLIGIIFTTEGGFHWFNLFNRYAFYFGLLLVGCIMFIIVNWGYGYFFTYKWRLVSDIKLMVGFEPNLFFRICWMIISPSLLLFAITYAVVDYSPIDLNGVAYPKWADDLGLCMSCTSVAMVPLYIFYRLISAWHNGEDWKKLVLPHKKWRPQDLSVPYNSLREPSGDEMETHAQDVDDNIPEPFPLPA